MTRQRTIKDPVVLEGIGLQTGKKVTLQLKSSPANSGINFIRADLPNKPLLNIQSLILNDSLPAPGRRTTLGSGPIQVQTTEHLLAALSGFGIDNILAELDSVELPGLDGSSKGFVDILKKAGIIEQSAEKKVYKVEEAVWCMGEDSLLAVFPDDNLRISYTMSYPKNAALGTAFLDIVVDEKSFEKEIAPARTFCLQKEALMLLALGLGKGASYENTLVMGRSGPVKNVLRFQDEPIRHKILDLIGDLYILGMPIRGHVVAIKSGHRLNLELVRKLRGLT